MVIEAEKLFVRIQEEEILRGIDLFIQEGETVVLLGPSGSGKTVFLKVLLGLIKPYSGRLSVLGYDMFNISRSQLFELRKKTGVVFQSAALFDSMRVWENVGFALIEHTKMPHDEIRRQVQQVLEAVGLSDVMDRRPEELSGGMRKRVGIARALIMKPQLLFYDEPTTGLDVITASSILNLMEDLHKRFKTTEIIVTHDLSIARKFADRIAVINQGKIIRTGRWQDYVNSKDDFVRNFFKIGVSHES